MEDPGRYDMPPLPDFLGGQLKIPFFISFDGTGFGQLGINTTAECCGQSVHVAVCAVATHQPSLASATAATTREVRPVFSAPIPRSPTRSSANTTALNSRASTVRRPMARLQSNFIRTTSWTSLLSGACHVYTKYTLTTCHHPLGTYHLPLTTYYSGIQSTWPTLASADAIATRLYARSLANPLIVSPCESSFPSASSSPASVASCSVIERSRAS